MRGNALPTHTDKKACQEHKKNLKRGDAMNKIKLIKEFVQSKIDILGKNSEYSQKLLRELCKIIGKHPGNCVEVWDLTLRGLPDELATARSEKEYEADGPRAGWAIHTALSLYAWRWREERSQSAKNKCSLATALGKLVKTMSDQIEFNRYEIILQSLRLLLGCDMETFALEAKKEIQRLKDSNAQIDFPKLAADIYRLQTDEKELVQREWFTDFHTEGKGAEDLNDN
jgi:hypothetical protein